MLFNCNLAYFMDYLYDTNTTHEGMMWHFQVNRSKVKFTRVIQIIAVGAGVS